MVTAVLAVAAGILIGVSLGALGGGGSILAVPALVYLLGQSPHQATAVSLLVVGIAAVAGALTHARSGKVRLREGAVFGVLGIAGSYAGSRASAAVPANVLLAGFGVLMLAIAVIMMRKNRSRPKVRAGDRGDVAAPEHGEPDGDRPAAERGGRHRVLVAAAATGVGLLTGFFGVGGGFVIVPALVLILGFDMPAAAGTSLVVIAIDSAASLATRAAHGTMTVDWRATAVFLGAAIAGTILGGRAAGLVSPRRLSIAFTILIIVTGAYTLARSLPAIA